jgi:hypothetical protein
MEMPVETELVGKYERLRPVTNDTFLIYVSLILL